jgi:transposase-like protein
MKKPTGRRPCFPRAITRIIAEKAARGEMSYSQAARVYNVSEGAVGAWIKALPVETLRQPKLMKCSNQTDIQTQARAEIETEILCFMQELSALDQEVLTIKTYHDHLFS